MGIIQKLDPQVAERIAAGEVVERPSSIVKELVENSLDAGATEISVRLVDGGKDLIEVIDNGSGMSADDLQICIERHATSKIKKLNDLENLNTLGFRGEALPSIAAVAQVEITSALKEQNANQLIVSSFYSKNFHQNVAGNFLGSNHGTRFSVRGLFSEIPARLKFLKSAGAEVLAVREWLERLALTHPQTGFTLFSGDKRILRLSPSTEINRVQEILSGENNFPIQSFQKNYPDLGLNLRGYWIQGYSSGQLRKVFQIVNHRAIRDRTIQQAILTAFKQSLLPGQFPAAAIFLEISPSEIDVNVHPAKTEVRFIHSSHVFQAVENSFSKLIEEKGAPQVLSVQKQFLGSTYVSTPTYTFSETTPSLNFQSSQQPLPSFLAPLSQNELREQLPLSENSLNEEAVSSAPSAIETLFYSSRYIGQIFKTYLIFEKFSHAEQNECILVDQHAAHERIRYERLKQRFLSRQNSAIQSLLIPEVIHIEDELTELHLGWLNQMGFDVESFGESIGNQSYVFRSIPAEWGTSKLNARLKSLLERVASLPKLEKDETAGIIDANIFEKIASESCRYSIMGGDRLEPLQVEQLIKDLQGCEHPWNCPHGRPTVVKIPEGKWEEWFQRRV